MDGPIRLFSETMSRAVLLAGLIWEPHGSNDLAQTKKGVPLYNGTARGFEVWAYRIVIKLGALNCVNPLTIFLGVSMSGFNNKTKLRMPSAIMTLCRIFEGRERFICHRLSRNHS